jgi:hypothetical protein
MRRYTRHHMFRAAEGRVRNARLRRGDVHHKGAVGREP